MKKKLIRRKFKFINFILYPTERQNPVEYVKVLSRIFADRLSVRTSGEKQTFMTELIQMGSNYRGVLSNAIFVDPDSKVIDKDSYVIKASEINPNEGLNLKQWTFYFFPKYHRMAIESAASLTQAVKFFQNAFKEIVGDEELYTISIETDKGFINRIIEAKGLSRLTVNISYTNNDNVEDWDEIMDEQLRSSGANKSQFTFKSSAAGSIQPAKSKMMSAILNLSKSNGNAKATIIRDDGKLEVVNTDNHPKIAVVSYAEDEEPTRMLEGEVELISRNHDNANG